MCDFLLHLYSWKNNSTSDENNGNMKDFEFPDFDSFMAPFRKYKTDMAK